MQRIVQRSFFAISLNLALFLFGASQPARAYYWNYYGSGQSYSLLWPISGVPLQLLGLGYGYGGYGGYNLLTNMLYGTAYTPRGYLPFAGRYQTNSSGTSTNGFIPQNQPYNYQAPTDVVYYQPHKNALPEQAGQPAFNDPLVSQLPPIAPGHSSSGSAETADNFLWAVSTKYGGDLTRALKDQKVHSWAETLNLADAEKLHHLNLKGSRKQAISRVLKDPSLDSTSKIEALRILLR